MIQRIQTVYLFLVSLLSLAFTFLNDYIINFSSNVVASLIDLSAIVLAVLSLVALMMFKNRKLQLTLSIVGVLMALISAGLYIYVDGISSFYLDWQFYFIPLVIFAIILARKGIKKDEEIIKSSYRLR